MLIKHLHGRDFCLNLITTTRKVNGGRKLLGLKGPKTASSNVRNRLKFGSMSEKDLLCTKM